jgi:SAM-dependent methyltransferase
MREPSDNQTPAGVIASSGVDPADAAVVEVGRLWADNPYYQNAEKFTYVFWDEGRPFRRMFNRLDLDDVVEIACGHGRHSAQFVEHAGHVTLSDIHQGNLDAARARLSGYANTTFHLGNGRSLQPLTSNKASAVFSYDAMVHFAPEVVFAYLAEIKRVLRPGGLALLHHSNYDAPPGAIWHHNPHGRNRMTQALFREGAVKAELEVVETVVMPWGQDKDLDALTLMRA